MLDAILVDLNHAHFLHMHCHAGKPSAKQPKLNAQRGKYPQFSFALTSSCPHDRRWLFAQSQTDGEGMDYAVLANVLTQTPDSALNFACVSTADRCLLRRYYGGGGPAGVRSRPGKTRAEEMEAGSRGAAGRDAAQGDGAGGRPREEGGAQGTAEGKGGQVRGWMSALSSPISVMPCLLLLIPLVSASPPSYVFLVFSRRFSILVLLWSPLRSPLERRLVRFASVIRFSCSLRDGVKLLKSFSEGVHSDGVLNRQSALAAIKCRYRGQLPTICEQCSRADSHVDPVLSGGFERVGGEGPRLPYCRNRNCPSMREHLS